VVTPDPPDEDLMRRYVERDDRDAFRALFDRYAGRLAAYFRRTVGSDPAAADLVQTTFLHVHRGRRDFHLDRAFRPWLFAIAANVKRDHARRRIRHPEDQVSAAPTEPVVATAPPTAADPAVRRALDRMTEPEREILVLHWYVELSYQEIAEALGTTVGAVKARGNRALQQLRSLLGVADGG
jgi:RNA polymerase sigma-70 factor (ECF subfamily)